MKMQNSFITRIIVEPSKVNQDMSLEFPLKVKKLLPILKMSKILFSLLQWLSLRKKLNSILKFLEIEIHSSKNNGV